MKKLIVLVCCMLTALLLFSQKTFPQDAVYDDRDGYYAFTNATIYTSYNTKIENGTLLIKDGKVISAGKGIAVPKDAVTIDLKGKYIYPSFIDLCTSYGLPAPKAIKPEMKWKPQEFSNKKGAYSWNEALTPEYSAVTNFKVDAAKAKSLRGQGFGAVLSHQRNAIARGTGSLILLGEGREHLLVLKDKASNHFSFSKGRSTQGYPSSLMGAIALLRQTHMDAEWYKNHGSKEEYNNSLQAWNNNKLITQFFEVRDWQEALRATKIGQEFNQKYVIKGSGDEYKRVPELKATGQSFIIPVNYPKVYDVEDPYVALQIHIHQMKHWELAPTNAQVLSDAGIEFAFTTNGLEDIGDFLKNIKESIKLGLTEEAALKALTATPAKIINASTELGSLERGKRANFIIASGNIFEEKTNIYHNWINGKAHVIKHLEAADVTGAYTLNVGRTAYNLEISGTEAKPKIQLIIDDTTKVDVKHTIKGNLVTLSFEPKEKTGFTSLSGLMQGTTWDGKGTDSKGNWIDWTAKRTGDVEEKEDDKKEDKEKEENKDEKAVAGPIIYPFMPFGNTTIPKQETFLIQNATVWTNEAEGIVEETDVLIQNGKIAKIGKGLSASGCTVIDAKGKHLTSGIIDEHSHICISRGVNEGTQNSSAEVSIRDVVNSEDVNIYRQLAGGVTMAQLLHGSANPIGGQAALIKMRWGYTPEQMKYANAPQFIKFALGENVKQSNWGDDNSVRFPQTRMGVEQVFIDHFTRAQEYSKALKSGKPVRRDLELDALKDIIESRMFITCHSYVQSEINMLMKTAEAFDFRINTFTHILEGYKVADKMREHGAGGSTFSDWWAYKYEVIDAIAYNGAILNEQGIVTAFNSDDAEMGRRLNQEAGKAVMYGNVSEEDAWKFVTLNPAKLLRVDDKVGSIKVGKDADLVVWSDNPLSIYAQAEHTFIDGIQFYNKEEDLKKRAVVNAERTRLIQKLVQAKKDGKPTQKVKKEKEHLYHCDHIEDEIQD